MVLLERLCALGARWRGPYQCRRLDEEMIFKLRLEQELTRNVLAGDGEVGESCGLVWNKEQSQGEETMGRENLKKECTGCLWKKDKIFIKL